MPHGKYKAHHPPLPDKPGTNWVEKAGGLPGPIDAVARALKAKGYTTSRAVATAVNHVRKVCATGRAFGGRTPVSAAARAKACAAATRWEAMKASTKVNTSIPADERRQIELAFKRIEGEILKIDMATTTPPAKEGLINYRITRGPRKGQVVQGRRGKDGKFYEIRTNTARGNPRAGRKFLVTKDAKGRTVHRYRIGGKIVNVVVKPKKAKT